MPLPNSSNNTPDLLPEGVYKSNTDQSSSKSHNIKLPKGIKSGVYLLSVNIERGECHVIPADMVEEGGQSYFHQTARIDNNTGKLVKSNRVSLSPPPRTHVNNTTQTTQTPPPPSQSLPTPELDTNTVGHTRADTREREHQDTVHTPGTDRVIDLQLGREPRVFPTGNVGPYQTHTVQMQTLGSYATAGGLSKVPTLDKAGKLVSSTVPNFPAISANSLLSVYSATHRISGLPEHVEQVHRADLGLPLLKDLLEYDLGNVDQDSQLNCIVVDFLIDVSKPVSWHTSLIHQIVKLFTDHPSGGFCKIGQTFFCPKYVQPPTISSRFTPPN